MSVTSVPAVVLPSTAQENGLIPADSFDTDEVPDDILYEVIDGKIVEKTVGATEVDIANILNEYLVSFARTQRLGRSMVEMIFRIDATKNLQRRPDVAFVSRARLPFRRRGRSVAVWDMVPDLAVEVVSPSNKAYEIQQKIHEYFDAGVRQVWIIYPPEREIYIFRSTRQIEVLQMGQELDGGDLVPGFKLPLANLFEVDAESGAE